MHRGAIPRRPWLARTEGGKEYRGVVDRLEERGESYGGAGSVPDRLSERGPRNGKNHALERGSTSGARRVEEGECGGERGERGKVPRTCKRRPAPARARSEACRPGEEGVLSAHIGGRSGAAGTRRRERREGVGTLACCGRRGASAGVLGRPEVVGGVGQMAATVLLCTIARSGAPVWPAPIFLRGKSLSTSFLEVFR